MKAAAPKPSEDKGRPELVYAWEAYTRTRQYADTKIWAGNSAHVDDALWASYLAGFLAAESKVAALEQQLAEPKRTFPNPHPEQPIGAYLKEGESVLERLERYHKEVSSLMGLLANERSKVAALEQQLEAMKRDVAILDWLAARVTHLEHNDATGASPKIGGWWPINPDTDACEFHEDAVGLNLREYVTKIVDLERKAP